MKNSEILHNATSEMQSVSIKMDAARSCIYMDNIELASKYIKECEEKARECRSLLGRIGEDDD